MGKEQETNKKLYEKMSNEYDRFIDHLKTLPPDEIIRHSYEKVFKEDILMCFEDSDLDYKKAKALLLLKNPLDDLYNEWLDTDVSYMDMLRDCIDNRAFDVLKHVKNKTKER